MDYKALQLVNGRYQQVQDGNGLIVGNQILSSAAADPKPLDIAATDTTTAATAGGDLTLTGGAGNTSGKGGDSVLRGGTAGNSAVHSGAIPDGGSVTIVGGLSPNDWGGNVNINGASGDSVNGVVNIGTLGAAPAGPYWEATGAVNIGRATITTTVTGSLTQLTGAFSLTGSGSTCQISTTGQILTITAGAGSTWSTSAGALTLTSNQAATWSTANGALTVQAATALNLGTTTTTSVSIGRTGQTTTVNGNTQIGAATNGTDTLNVLPQYLHFGNGADHTIDIVQVAAGAGKNLTISSGDGASGSAGGNIRIVPGRGASAGNPYGYVDIDAGNTGDGGQSEVRICNTAGSGNVRLGRSTSLVYFGAYGAESRIATNLTFEGTAGPTTDYTIGIEANDVGGALTVKSADGGAGNTASGALTLKSGDGGGGGNNNTGNVTLDVGVPTGTGTLGTISIGHAAVQTHIYGTTIIDALQLANLELTNSAGVHYMRIATGNAASSLEVYSADTTAAASGALTLRSGNAVGGDSGALTLDVGTASGTVGEVKIGTANAAIITVGARTIPSEVRVAAMLHVTDHNYAGAWGPGAFAFEVDGTANAGNVRTMGYINAINGFGHGGSLAGTLNVGCDNKTADLSLGVGATVTAISMGTNAATTTINIGTGQSLSTDRVYIGGGGIGGSLTVIQGDLRVIGVETIVGGTTFDAGVTFNEPVTIGDAPATGAITAFSNNGAGGTTVAAAAHGQLAGDTVKILSYTGVYDGNWVIFNVTGGTFDIGIAFTINDSPGTWVHGATDPDYLQFLYSGGMAHGVLGSAANPNVWWMKDLAHTFAIEESAAGVGGALTVAGGKGVATFSGGALLLNGGAGGAGGAANGGGVTVTGGAAGGGTAGVVTLGATNTATVEIGAAAVPTNVNGALTVTGTTTLNGNTQIGNAAGDTFTVFGATQQFDANGTHTINIAQNGAAGGNALTVSGGQAAAGAFTGGAANVVGGTGGDAAGTGPGGAAVLRGGTDTGASTALAGLFHAAGATGGGLPVTRNGGTVVTAGAAFAGTGGQVSILGGNAVAASGAAGGNIQISSGTGDGAGLVGTITLTTGVTGGTNRLIFTHASNTITVQAGTTLNTTSTGNIDLPNNASARFKIETVSVGATVTAANLDTLTNGSTNVTLHTHAAASATQILVTVVAGEVFALGQLVSMQNNGGVANGYKSNVATYTTKANVLGIAASATTVVVSGEVAIANGFWDSVPVVADVGKPVYASEITAGNLTLTAPSTSGNVVQKVGVLTVGGSGACTVVVQIGDNTTL